MSRAFVKEPEGDQAEEQSIEKPQSVLPNYITAAGLARMKQSLEDLREDLIALKNDDDQLQSKGQVKRMEADIRYLEKRIQCAIPIDISRLDLDEVRFGATVDLVDENGEQYHFQIVGEDEADIERGLLGWSSPLAREIIGKREGDTFTWKRPTGDIELEIVDFSYKPSE